MLIVIEWPHDHSEIRPKFADFRLMLGKTQQEKSAMKITGRCIIVENKMDTL